MHNFFNAECGVQNAELRVLTECQNDKKSLFFLHASALTLLLKIHEIFRRNNGANESPNSPPAMQWIGGVPRRGEVV